MYLSLLPSHPLLNDVKYLFLEMNEVIYFWLHWVFVVASELSLAAVSGLLIAVASLVADMSSREHGRQWSWPPGSRKCGLQWSWLAGLAAPQHVESSQTRDGTSVPCFGR